MKVRTRILLGYWYLVALLIAGAAGAALSFLSLGRSIGTVLEENFESVRASMAMLDALERQDSAVLASLLGDADAAIAVEASQRSFVAAIDAARANITISGEAEVLDRIEQGHFEFTAARDRLLQGTWDRPLAAYQFETQPLFVSLKAAVYELLDLNHRAMVEADERAQRAARRRAVVYGILVVVALLSLAVLSQVLGRDVLARLGALSTTATAIASGDTSRRAIPGGEDELGVVARQLNAVLDRAQATEAELEGRLRQDRQLLLALLQAHSEPGALLSLAGDVVASTLTRGDLALIESMISDVGPVALRERRPTIEVATDGRRLRLSLLAAGDERPVGWLATVH